MGNRQDKIDSLRRYTHLIQKQTGRVVRPYRYDGYVNMLNKYGTAKDVSERYEFRQEPPVPDDTLTMYYEGNGLFAKIIDAPAEEAIKNGFVLDGLTDQPIIDFCMEALDELDWEETMMTAVKWARLFGGAIAVMMINDGRGVDEPLDWYSIKSIDDIRIYDRSLIQPDYGSMFSYDPDDPFGTRGSRLGMPEYYNVYSRFGNFRVHDSRCLVFQNGILPENTTNSVYQLWGMPEYIRLKRAIRDAEVAHGTAPKLLDRSVQAVYKMRDLSAELATEEGEDRVLRRLQTIDMARGLLNSITIDSEGEEYDFRQFTFTGVSEIIDATCNFLSALTNIPQTILFGRSPAGMNATGQGDLENWYNYLSRIQNRMIKKNLRYLISIIFQAGVSTGEIDEVPPIKVKFNPLWSLSEQEEAALEQTKASTANMRANTANVYVQMQVLDPSEVRKKLADSEEFDIETMLDEYTDEELEENDPAKKAAEGGGMPGMGGGGMPGMEMPGGAPPDGGMPGGAPEGMPEGAPDGGKPEGAQEPAGAKGAPDADKGQGKQEKPVPKEAVGLKQAPSTGEHDTDIGGNAPAAAPAATKLPQDMSKKEKEKAASVKKPEDGDTLRNAWEGNTPKAEETPKKSKEAPKKPEKGTKGPGGETEEPEDTLKNAWEGITKPGEAKPEEAKERPKAPAKEPEEQKRVPEDTLRNAWLGETPKSGADPGDAKRNAAEKPDGGLKEKPDSKPEGKAEKEPEDEPKKPSEDKPKTAQKDKPEDDPEDTLRNAWLGNTPAKEDEEERDTLRDAWEGRTKEPSIVRARKRHFRTVPRGDSGNGAVGVYVIKDGKILTGVRGNGDGEHLICGPGGHIEDGETPGQAAIRETQEEFGITPMELIPFGRGDKEANGLRPWLFLCVRYEGEPECDEDEMHQARFTPVEEIEYSGRLFPPFEAGYRKLVSTIGTNA